MTKDQRIVKYCRRCGDEFKCSPSHAKLRKNCSLKCSNNGVQKNTGRTHFKKGHNPTNKGKGQEYISAQGYKWIWANGKKFPEHNFIWCNQPGNLEYVPKGFIIHHLNGIKLDNRPENLVLLDNSTHSHFHLYMKNYNTKRRYDIKDMNIKNEI